jgi:hypothetical protein
MSERLQYLLTLEHEPRCERDRIDSLAAAARMPGRRLPRWARRHALVAA